MTKSRLKADTLAASVLMLLIVTVVQRAIGLGRGVLFCRWLTPETLGQWEMIYSFLLMAAPLAVLGIPGSFGRYLEHYRQRGHLRTFLRRTMLWTGFCAVSTVIIIFALAPKFSQLLFGSQEHTTLIYGVALCLATMILQHTLISLFNAMRLFRIVSVINFTQSMLFAGLALGLLLLDFGVASILIGYSLGCLAASIGALIWAWPALRDVEQPTETLPQRDFWSKLMRFAFFVWVTNVLAHLFGIIDRYMIVHFGGMNSSEALEQVGHYHSSLIIPILMISFADVLSGLVMPHLSHDWEAGKKEKVSQQLKLGLKLTCLGMLGFGVCVLVFSPLLFDVVLEGKYSQGLYVLPTALASCVWFGYYLFAQNYLWCAEKARLATIPLAVGLCLNIALNLVLLPIWGLLGAVVATAASTFICLTIVLLLSSRHGLKLDFGLWLLVVSPVSLAAGEAIACGVLLILLVATVATSMVLNQREHTQLKALIMENLQKLEPLLPKQFILIGQRPLLGPPPLDGEGLGEG